MFISIVCWLALGAVIGVIAGQFVDSGGDDPKLGVAIAAICAAVGGYLHRLHTGYPANWPGVMSLLVAASAAALAVALWHLSRRSARA